MAIPFLYKRYFANYTKLSIIRFANLKMDSSANPINSSSKRQLSAWTISLVIHGLLALTFFFFFQLTPPNPPWGTYGVAVNFGFDETGFGEEQSFEPAGSKTDNASTENDIGQTNPKETGLTPLATGTEESPVEVPTESANSSTTGKIVPNPSKNQVPQVGKSGNSNLGGASEGNDPNTTGNKGKPNGDLTSLNYEGTPGNGGNGNGASLDLAGWIWERKPDVKDKSEEEGKIVFQITIDEEGEIIGIKTLEKTVSNSVERFYRAEVEKLTFLKKRGYNAIAGTSTGTITFRIKGE